MTIKDIIAKVTGTYEREDLPDDITTDKYLRSLRRQRRLQMEEVEKEQLKKDVEEYNKLRARKHLWGVKEEVERKKQLIDALNKKRKVDVLKKAHSILKEKSMLNNRKDEFKKAKNSQTWVGKYRI